MVANEEQYTDVLQLEFEPRDEGNEARPQLDVPDRNPVMEAAIIKAKEKHVEGEAPPPSLSRQITPLIPAHLSAWTIRNNICESATT